MTYLVGGSRPAGRPGCGTDPDFSRKPSIPVGCPSPEAAFLEESEISQHD